MTSACFCVAKMVTAMLAHVDLCSGIGGFALGFQWAGLSRPVLFCDIEEWSRKVLAKHWPDVPISDDVKELASDPRRLVPDCDILTAGYPCQPFSLAGKRRGEKDDRHIWPEIFTIVQAKRPRWCVFENVSGHINMGLDQVLSDLEGEGYTVQPFVVPACAVDAPHRRDRVWIIAAHADSESQSDVAGHGEEGQWLVADASGRRHRVAEEKIFAGGDAPVVGGARAPDVGHAKDDGRDRWPAQVRRAGAQDFTKQPESGVWGKFSRSNQDVADASCELSHRAGQPRQGRRRQYSDSGENVAHADSQRGCSGDTQRQHAEAVGQSPRHQRNNTRRMENGVTQSSVGGMADGLSIWLDEPRDIPRVATGVKQKAARLKGLGNAIVPQIAMQIGLTIKAVENG